MGLKWFLFAIHTQWQLMGKVWGPRASAAPATCYLQVTVAFDFALATLEQEAAPLQV